MKKVKAFTLVEMLVVIVLLGIVLTLVAPNVINLMNKGNSQKFEKIEKLTVEAAKMYALSYQGNLKDVNKISGIEGHTYQDACWNVPYSTLLKEELIQEEDITCSGSIILTKRDKSGYDTKSFLTCKDKNGDEYKTTDEAIPVNCLGFGGEFEIEYNLYTDSELTNEYKFKIDNQDNWSHFVYSKYTSVSPYGHNIKYYQYSIDGLNWNNIDIENEKFTNVASNVQKITNFKGDVFIRAVDSDGNISTVNQYRVATDSMEPTVEIVKNPLNLGTTDYVYTNNLKVEYGIQGLQELKCDQEKSEGLGNNVISCWAIGNNGLRKDVSFASVVDITPPTITAKNATITVNSLTYDFKNNIDVSYGLLGGVTTCNPGTASGQDQKTITVTCEAKGNNGKTSSVSFTAKVDATTPSISAKNATITVNNLTYDFKNNINVSYGYLSGSVICNPANSSGQNQKTVTVTCTATGNNGLSKSVSFTAKVDANTPSITAKSSSVNATSGYNFTNNINVSYGYLSGSVTCNPATAKSSTTSYTVTCTAKGNNNLSKSVTFTAIPVHKLYYEVWDGCAIDGDNKTASSSLTLLYVSGSDTTNWISASGSMNNSFNNGGSFSKTMPSSGSSLDWSLSQGGLREGGGSQYSGNATIQSKGSSIKFTVSGKFSESGGNTSAKSYWHTTINNKNNNKVSSADSKVTIIRIPASYLNDVKSIGCSNSNADCGSFTKGQDYKITLNPKGFHNSGSSFSITLTVNY